LSTPHPESLTENAASIFNALQQIEKDAFFRHGRDKPGHDEFRLGHLFHWLLFESDEERSTSSASRRMGRKRLMVRDARKGALLTMRLAQGVTLDEVVTTTADFTASPVAISSRIMSESAGRADDT
jgi:hypothetical protein